MLNGKAISDNLHNFCRSRVGVDLQGLIGLFESMELTLDEMRIHEVADSVFQSFLNQSNAGFEVYEAHLFVYLQHPASDAFKAEHAITAFSPRAIAARMTSRIASSQGFRSSSFNASPRRNFSMFSGE